jgi:hypothetical protein
MLNAYGQGRMQQRSLNVEMVWDPPEHRIEYSLSLIPWRKVEVRDALLLPPDTALRLSCTTIDDPPAAKTLCKEIEQRYLQAP